MKGGKSTNQCLYYSVPLVLVTTIFFCLTLTIKVCTQHIDCFPKPCLNQLCWVGISFKVFMTLWLRRAVNFTSSMPPFLESFKIFYFYILNLKLIHK